MLKKSILVNSLFLLTSITPFIHCMEEQNPPMHEEPEDSGISHLEALPLEILDYILRFLVQKPIGNSLDHALEFYKKTRNLQLTNNYFNQKVPSLIERILPSILHNSDQPLAYENNKNDLFTLMHYLPLEKDYLSHIRNYSIIKTAFENGSIYFLKDRGLAYRFNRGTDEEIIEIIELLYKIWSNHQLTSYSGPEHTINRISPDNLKHAINDANKKTLFQKLAQSKFVEHIANNLSRKIIKNNLDSLNLSAADLCLDFEGNTHYLYNLYTSELTPLKWAIIFDNIEVIQLILEYLDTHYPNRDHYGQAMDMLNFASAIAEPETLNCLLNYCKRYKVRPYQTVLEYLQERNPQNNPLQKAFDVGHEKNFLVLVKHGANIDKLYMRETTANKNSQLFTKLIPAKKYLTYNQQEFKKAAQQMSPTQMIKIVDGRIKQRYYTQKILIALGVGIIGFVGYKLFQKNNYSELLAKANLKIN